MLALATAVSCVTFTASAETVSGRNAYGHSVTYAPVRELYTGGERVRFFDAGITEWAKLGDGVTRSEAESIKWLEKNGYLLNRFGRTPRGTFTGGMNGRGEWTTYMKGPTNVRSWDGTVYFDKLSDKAERANGNFSSMYDKGDIQYFFSWKVKTVQTRWGLTGKSNDTGSTYALGTYTDSSGGGWKKYNTVADGPNLGYSAAWKPADTLKAISFVAKSDRDARVDSYMSGAMLVGKDIKGPKISSVKVTADPDGKTELENGTVTLENIDTLDNRTVYFRVEWDEPVTLKGLSDADIAGLSLLVDTIGADGTSGIVAEAPFLKFAPSINDAKPVMVFEYRIADPYTDTSEEAQERGFVYNFSKVTVSENENKVFWNSIYDLSGNKFAADENGIQPSGKVMTGVGGASRVDLTPFGINNIRLTKYTDAANRFVLPGELLGVTLELNKPFAKGAYTEDLPYITLNVKDENGEYITVKPDRDHLRKRNYYNGKYYFGGYFSDSISLDGTFLFPAMAMNGRNSIMYFAQMLPGYTVDGDFVKVTSVSSGSENFRDDSGYSFMTYELDDGVLSPSNLPETVKGKIAEYKVSPDKQYRLDFDPPEISVSAEDVGEGVIMIKAEIDDASVEGCDAAITVKVSGNIGDSALMYQASAYENYNGSAWQNGEENVRIASFASPVVNVNEKGAAYGFVKLPEKSEISGVEVSIKVSDEAGNSASASKTLTSPEWNGFDTLAPIVTAKVKGEEIEVEITDSDDDVYYMYGYSDNDTDEPQYTTAGGKNGTIPSPELPEDNAIHKMTVWIKAADSADNVSDPVKIPMVYDRTYTSISITADTDKTYAVGEYPSAEITVGNTSLIRYMWVEKPAGTSDTAAYIAEKCLDDIAAFAEKYGSVITPEDDNPETPQYNNTTDFSSALDGDTLVVKMNPEDETCGDAVRASETSRPLMLVITAERDDGTTLVTTAEFDTIYSAPEVSLRQRRFSTNNSVGARSDYIRSADGKGLMWADGEKSLNTPNLFGFAEAEFYLEGDPVTNLDRIDTANSTLTLERVVYDTYDFAGGETERTTVKEWQIDDIFGALSSGVNSAVVNIEPTLIDTEYKVYDEEKGGYLGVRYEFVCNMGYIGGIDSEKKTIAYYAFNNKPEAFIGNAFYYTKSGYDMTLSRFEHYEKVNVEAEIDADGNDVTKNIPVYAMPIYDSGKIYIRFSPGELYSDILYFGAPSLSEDTDRFAVRVGDSYDNLSEYLPIKSDGYSVLSEPYFIGENLTENEDDIVEKTIYYRFEYPDRGIVSPTYVMIIRRDNKPPVYDISISETKLPVGEVLVKVNSLTDTQTSADGKRVVVDTPERVLAENAMFVTENGGAGYALDAWRAATENDDIESIPEEDVRAYISDYDPETDREIYTYEIRVVPDSDGVYHFTSNGWFTSSTEDNAGNRNREVLINGELVDVQYGGMDWPCYYITNVGTTPPSFTDNPEFTVNREDGSFEVSAEFENTAKNVYIKFDKAYEALFTDADNAKYELSGAPGVYSSEFDSENGKVSAKVYVKYSDTIPLSAVTLVIASPSGNETEYKYTFDTPLFGRKPEITNAPNENGCPVYGYGKTLDFNVPVKLSDFGTDYGTAHGNLPVYADGVTTVSFDDLFGENYGSDVYFDIFGAAFAHTTEFYADGERIDPETPVSADVTVKINVSGTDGLTVDGGKTEYTFTENGTLSYSLRNAAMGETKSFSFPITCIDKTPPTATVNLSIDSETDAATGKKLIYSLTYSIEGFSEDGVEIIPESDGSAPMGVTFDFVSADKSHTFRFRDKAGNEGSYTADASDIEFTERSDVKIADYRLTYYVADTNGFNTIGVFGKGDSVPNLGLYNKAVNVKIEALNKSGEVVSSSVAASGTVPEGTTVYGRAGLVVFDKESDKDRTVLHTLTGTGSANTESVSVFLPANTIDVTAPTGTVRYESDGDAVRVYLVTTADDIADGGISVSGTKSDGTPFVLGHDEKGYYTEFDRNGVGKFVMVDKAGNIGTVSIAVFTLDKEPPEVVYEGWQSVIDAKTKEEIKELLSTPTNNTVKLFITFNELIRGADVKAYGDGEKTEELLPTEEYVTATASGATLTVEFRKNCLAMLTVYDLRGNACVLWRPEDGPITVIDRDIPKPESGYPLRVFDPETNTVTVEYVFADGEEVKLLKDDDGDYRNSHRVTFTENGAYTLSFADKAGNVYSDYPVITETDDLAPNVRISFDYVGDGATLDGNETYIAGNMYTSKNVRILLNVEDAKTPDGVEVTAKTKSGKTLPVVKADITSNGKLYNYSVTVTENGAYTITARDKWGHENTVETSVSVIDRTAPTIKLAEKKIVIEAGAAADDVKKAVLESVTATDLESGANAPMGTKIEATNGVSVTADVSAVNTARPGSYTVKVTASDRLGNTAEKFCTVIVVKDMYIFTVNGATVYAGDVFTTAKGRISLANTDDGAKFRFSKGYKTAARMKYALTFDPNSGFEATESGYYTILAQESGRKMFLLYVYVN